MEIKRLKNPLTNEYKLLKEHILGQQFSWYWKPNCVLNSDAIEFLSHTVLQRPSPKINGSLYPKVQSKIVEDCENVLRQIFQYNDISINYILRININLTLQTFEKKSIGPHVDHPFDHKNLIIYFNESDGETVLCDDNDNDVDFSEPEEDKIIMFSGKHYHVLPSKNSRRVVMVCTFV